MVYNISPSPKQCYWLNMFYVTKQTTKDIVLSSQNIRPKTKNKENSVVFKYITGYTYDQHFIADQLKNCIITNGIWVVARQKQPFVNNWSKRCDAANRNSDIDRVTPQSQPQL